MKKYTTLLPGDIRQEGDIFVPKQDCPCNNTSQKWKRDYGAPERNIIANLEYPVSLIGHPILLIDLIADTFYRPNHVN